MAASPRSDRVAAQAEVRRTRAARRSAGFRSSCSRRSWAVSSPRALPRLTGLPAALIGAAARRSPDPAAARRRHLARRQAPGRPSREREPRSERAMRDRGRAGASSRPGSSRGARDGRRRDGRATTSSSGRCAASCPTRRSSCSSPTTATRTSSAWSSLAPAASAPGCQVDSPDQCVAGRRAQTQVFARQRGARRVPDAARPRPAGSCSAVCVPVSIMGRTVGVVHATGPVGEPLDDERRDRRSRPWRTRPATASACCG